MKVKEAFIEDLLIWGWIGDDDNNGLYFVCNHNLEELAFKETRFDSSLYRIAMIFSKRATDFRPFDGDYIELGRKISAEYVKFKLKN